MNAIKKKQDRFCWDPKCQLKKRVNVHSNFLTTYYFHENYGKAAVVVPTGFKQN